MYLTQLNLKMVRMVILQQQWKAELQTEPTKEKQTQRKFSEHLSSLSIHAFDIS